MNNPTNRQTRAKQRLGVQQKAKNYISEQAKSRMLDLGRVSAESWRNSIEVEGYEMLYYSVTDAGFDCSCRTNTPAVLDEENGVLASPSVNDIVGDKPGKPSKTFTVTALDDPFALDKRHVSHQPIEDYSVNDSDLNGEKFTTDVGSLDFIEEMFADGVDCGICYRRGLQPGYQMLGYERTVLTSLNLLPASTVEIVNSQPDVIIPHGPALWELRVPRYWTEVRFAIRNNHEDVEGSLSTDAGVSISQSVLHSFRGSSIIIQLTTESEFTHVVFEFKHPAQPLKVSIPQLQEMKDYRKLLAIPSTTLVVPNFQRQCSHGDMLYCPRLRLMWKVSEVQPLMLLDRHQVGWSLQARVMQPNETAWSISSTKVLR